MSSWAGNNPFKMKTVRKSAQKPVSLEQGQEIVVDAKTIASLLKQDNYVIGIGVLIRKSEMWLGQEKEKEKEKRASIRQSF